MNGSTCSCLHDEGCWVADELTVEKAIVEKLRAAIEGYIQGYPNRYLLILEQALADTEAK